MSSIKAVYNDLVVYSDLIADAVLARVSPLQDDITEKEARKLYGRDLVDSAISEVGISFRLGPKGRILSRRELNAVKSAFKLVEVGGSRD